MIKGKSKKENVKSMKAGQAMLFATIIFLAISLTIIFGMVVPVVNHVKEVTLSNNSKQSYILAEALNEDALYRLNSNKNLSSNFSISLNNATATASVLTSGGTKQITTQGTTNNNVIRKISTSFTQGQGISFNYGVQVGEGGFILNGGSRVNGNIYSNGNIVATNGVIITGSAVAADSAALSADQVNNSPTIPTHDIVFATTTNYQDFAQSFQVSSSSAVNKVQFYIKKVSTPSDASVYIVSDNNGSPSTNIVTQGSLSASLVGTSYAWINVVFTSNPVLTPGVTYWLVIDTSSNSSKYYVIGGNSGGYSNGSSKLGKYGGTWYSNTPYDGYFQLYLGGLVSTIGGDTYSGGVNIGSNGVGDAWANRVQGATVAGHLYCQTGQYNNKSCDTSKGDPTPVGFPISDANIQEWKNEAAGGTIINGNVTVDYRGTTTGPTEITGNLTLGGGGTLTITGTLWVRGNIILGGGAKIVLDSSYGANSGVLLSDGWIDLEGGGNINGSGTPGSYILILTTSNCPYSGSCTGPSGNAMTLSGGAGAVVLNAQNGVMALSGGVNLNEATAYQISATGGTTITYQSGLVNLNFSSGPSGSWNVLSWQEVP